LKIAHISSLFHPLPPKAYGGTQRVIAQISAFQALLQGHEVYVYGAADSQLIEFTKHLATKANLVYYASANAIHIKTLMGQQGSLYFRTTGTKSSEVSMLNQSREHMNLVNLVKSDDQRDNFDIIHCHKPIFLNSFLDAPHRRKIVLHAHDQNIPLDLGYCVPIIAVSQTQKQKLEEQGHNVLGVAYNSIDLHRYSGTSVDAGYLCFLGTFKPEKGANLAIQIAKRAGIPLFLAGAADSRPTSQAYYSAQIMPYIDYSEDDFLVSAHTLNAALMKEKISKIIGKTSIKAPIIYIGNIDDHQKKIVLGNSLACLFPISWQEPFGLVMIESFANGTPVIANTTFKGKSCGSPSEVVIDGKTGFHIASDDEEDCIKKSVLALQNIHQLDRQKIRNVFEETWCSEIRVNDLNQIYRTLLEQTPSVSQNIYSLPAPN
jgi:glycosyltransferase involved in cell wall biosynthesis